MTAEGRGGEAPFFTQFSYRAVVSALSSSTSSSSPARDQRALYHLFPGSRKVVLIDLKSCQKLLFLRKLLWLHLKIPPTFLAQRKCKVDRGKKKFVILCFCVYQRLWSRVVAAKTRGPQLYCVVVYVSCEIVVVVAAWGGACVYLAAFGTMQSVEVGKAQKMTQKGIVVVVVVAVVVSPADQSKHPRPPPSKQTESTPAKN